jgi:hypothetical protein
VTRVDIWIDPACPWCWITSRWLVEVRDRRPLDVRWRAISLRLKNDSDLPVLLFTHGLLRTLLAVRTAVGNGAAERFYAAAGNRIHVDGVPSFPVEDALLAAGLDPGFAAAFDDPAWDEAIAADTAAALELAGDDVGTPIVAVDVDRTGSAYFGPVVSPCPTAEEALALWDAFVGLVAVPGFNELKRSRRTKVEPTSVPAVQLSRRWPEDAGLGNELSNVASGFTGCLPQLPNDV